MKNDVIVFWIIVFVVGFVLSVFSSIEKPSDMFISQWTAFGVGLLLVIVSFVKICTLL